MCFNQVHNGQAVFASEILTNQSMTPSEPVLFQYHLMRHETKEETETQLVTCPDPGGLTPRFLTIALRFL